MTAICPCCGQETTIDFTDHRRMRRIPHIPTEEHRRKIGAAISEAHARRRGFHIPEDKRELYVALQRNGHSVEDIKRRLGIE